MKVEYEDWGTDGIPNDIDLSHPINKKISEDLVQIQSKHDGIKRITIAVSKVRGKQDKIAALDFDKGEDVDVYDTENLILKIITHYAETISQSTRFRIHLYPWKYGISAKVSQTDIRVKNDSELDDEYIQEFSENELNQLKISLIEKGNLHKQLMETYGLLASVMTGMKDIAQTSQEKYLQLADKNVELGRLALQGKIFDKEQETEEKIALMKEETKRKRNESFSKVVGNITKNPQVMGMLMKKLNDLIPGNKNEQQGNTRRETQNQKTDREIWLENNPLTHFSKVFIKKNDKSFDNLNLSNEQKSQLEKIFDSKNDSETKEFILELSSIDGVNKFLDLNITNEELKIIELYINEIGPRSIYSKLLKESIDDSQWENINELFDLEEKEMFNKTLDSENDEIFENNFNELMSKEDSIDKLFKLKELMNEQQMNILNKMLGLE